MTRVAVPREDRFPNDNRGMRWITPSNPLIDPKQVSGGMANRPPPKTATKNPGGLAGHTGVRDDLAGQQERTKAYSIPAVLS